MDFHFSRFEIMTGTGALFLGLAFICVFVEASAIENEIGAGAMQAVERQDLFWAGVEARGQHLVLSGAAPDYLAKQRASELAAGIAGVVGVDNRINIIGEAGTCQWKMDEYLKDRAVTFKAGRPELTESSFPVLAMVASIARGCGAAFEVAAHTDGSGDAAVNLKLSQRRAEVAVRHLVQSGVDPARLKAVGYGKSQPIADNAKETGRSANRRLEFRVMGSSE